MNNLYFDTFKSEEKDFYDACKVFKPELIPSWHHFWFYRYLQISPSYLFIHNRHLAFLAQKKNPKIKIPEYNPKLERQKLDEIYKKDKTLENAKAILQHKLNSSAHYKNVSRTYDAFGDVWNLSFAMWWYKRGQHQFKPNVLPTPEITEYYKLPFNKQLWKYEFEEIQEKIDDHYLHMITQPLYPTVVNLCIPMRDTKRKTMKLISKYLDKNINFSVPELSAGFYSINKCKMREGRVRDCYKVLELRTYQDKPVLLDLAKKANVIKTTLAGYEEHTDPDLKSSSLNSLRAGTRRQIASALILAENAAAGQFPNLKKPDYSQAADFSQLKNLFEGLSKKRKSTKFNYSSLLSYIDKKSKTQTAEDKFFHPKRRR
jgi:hypothetical protein